ncbi:FtsK/SpoIIIE domain-containing protein [Streptomyces calidiresistens]|uniref:Plasmid transfer protein n=1 Tax=Streptomyces calidiresistens TaxID=1485586 RepID=A0A7W3T304_9ACTN|nr:FtsK/SpoIIIE domain-containing protein [Streptomyces calidiresistens]MBB0230005.1 plasmid transfer protein [Streptomyces calidiresistens]
MTRLLLLLAVLVAGVWWLRVLRPGWYWLAVAGPWAAVKVSSRYASVMDACGLTVDPSRVRLAWARLARRPVPPPRVPRLVGLRLTRTGLVLRIRLRPGQDAFDFSSAADRMRHAFGMQQVTSREVRAGLVEVRMTGYDVLRRVRMPRLDPGPGLRLPMALCEDGSPWWRDYRQVPHALNLGATQSGKSVYQRRLITLLAPRPDVALVGIDCKQGVELSPLARRFSALVDNADDALALLEALISRMEETYRLIRREQRISADTPDAEITADIWGLPDPVRPTAVVVVIDEVAELSLFSTKEEEKRRDAIVTALVRLAQLGRAAGIYLEICGQRFGADLGKGITMLRAQLGGRVIHRLNDEGSAKMALGDMAPDAVLSTVQISADRPGTAVALNARGGWSLVRTPHTSLRDAVTTCNAHAHLAPRLPELERFRPTTGGVSLIKSGPRPVSPAA